MIDANSRTLSVNFEREVGPPAANTGTALKRAATVILDNHTHTHTHREGCVLKTATFLLSESFVHRSKI